MLVIFRVVNIWKQKGPELVTYAKGPQLTDTKVRMVNIHILGFHIPAEVWTFGKFFGKQIHQLRCATLKMRKEKVTQTYPPKWWFVWWWWIRWVPRIRKNVNKSKAFGGMRKIQSYMLHFHVWKIVMTSSHGIESLRKSPKKQNKSKSYIYTLYIS